MVRVLITGVGGFIGAHVARRFVAEGCSVIGVDDFSSGKRENVPAGVDLVEGDLAESKNIEKIPPGCNLILHLAGQSSGEISFDDPVEDIRKNTVSTLNLIRYGIENKTSRMVYASSMSVYGDVSGGPTPETTEPVPLSCYGVGKLAAEGYLRVYAKFLPYVSLRMFNVYGPGQDMSNMRQGMVSIYLAQALQGGRVHVKGSLERYRDFVYIDDVVEAWYRAATRTEALNQVINLGTGVKTTVRQLLEAIGQKIPGATWYDQGSTPGDQHGIFADTARLKHLLKMDTFVSLESGLDKFAGWAMKKTADAA